MKIIIGVSMLVAISLLVGMWLENGRYPFKWSVFLWYLSFVLMGVSILVEGLGK